jgi:uncharacterized membrane protein YccC
VTLSVAATPTSSAFERFAAQSLPSRQDWLFATRTFAAAMTALALALWLDLPRPYWALATVYIATQSFAGATRSKALFRMLGTVAGGLAALVLVPLLVNAPLLLSIGLSLWVAFCLFFALLDRSPRSYAFMLAGYTAAIIGFPSVDQPDAIFDTVLSRSEEIILGIACAAVFATIIFPRGAGPALDTRIGAWLQDADAWALDALAGHAEDEAYKLQRRRLGEGIVELEALASSIAWDAMTGPGAARAMRTLRYDMLLLLPILSSVDDRVAGIAPPDRPRAAPALLATRDWVLAGAPTAGTAALTTAIDALEASTDGRADWPALMLASLAQRLRDYVAIRCACSPLRRQAVGLDRPTPGPDVHPGQHRDPGMAMLSASAAIVAILLVCTGWIATAWPDGAVAAEMAAVACSFFATRDNPVPAIVGFLTWSVVAVVIDALILFALLPQASSFEMLMLALAPIFLVYGILIARPATMPIGLALAANGSTLLGIQSAYAADFASFVNSALAFIVGMAIAAVVTALMRAVGAAWSVRRLQRANWATLADAASGYGRGDREQVAGLLLDRVALIAARLAAVEQTSPVHDVRALAEIRIGINVVELRRGRAALPDRARRLVEDSLDGLASYFAALARGKAPSLTDALLATLDQALDAVGRLPPSEARRTALQGLVGVHRGLCPDRTPGMEAVAA